MAKEHDPTEHIKMDVGYCDNCKYWKEPNNKMGMCLKTINGWEAGVGTMSEDGWEGGIYTGPYYGCVHFEEDLLNRNGDPLTLLK